MTSLALPATRADSGVRSHQNQTALDQYCLSAPALSFDVWTPATIASFPIVVE